MQHEENAELLNLSFSRAMKNLTIPKFSATNLLAERLSNPTLKVILKYKSTRYCCHQNANDNSYLRFSEVSVKEVYKR